MDEECVGCIHGYHEVSIFHCKKGFPPRPCKERELPEPEGFKCSCGYGPKPILNVSMHIEQSRMMNPSSVHELVRK